MYSMNECIHHPCCRCRCRRQEGTLRGMRKQHMLRGEGMFWNNGITETCFDTHHRT
jgi:hypothetical protein